MTDTTRTGADFGASYLRIWTGSDADQHHALIKQMWTPHESPYILSPALTVTGTADIAGRISRVHSDRTAGQSLTFSYDQCMELGDALLLCWSMAAPGGDIVGRGVDTALRGADDKVARVYMFIGVN